MNRDDATETGLAAVFEELVELVGETKQAAWTATSPERHRAFDDLRTYLGQQAAAVDDAERRLGARPTWVKSPTGHRPRNLAAVAQDDSDRLVELLVDDLRSVAADIRHRSAEVEGEWRHLLVGIADGLEARLDSL